MHEAVIMNYLKTQIFQLSFFKNYFLRASILIFFCQCFVNFTSNSQLKPIPIGTWRSHFDYTKAKSLAKVGNKIFVAAQTGFFVYNITENEASILNTENGFYDLNISQLGYHEATKTLIIAYNSGAIDLAIFDSKNEISSIKSILSIKNSATILDLKLTNSIIFNENIAFLATDFGIVQIDLAKKEIKEIDKNIGAFGDKISLKSIAIHKGKIYGISDKYLIISNLDSNLQDFSNWNATPLPSILEAKATDMVVANDQIYASFSSLGLYFISAGTFQKIIDIKEELFKIFTDSKIINIGSQSGIYQYNSETKIISKIADKNLKNVRQLLIDGGKIWVADGSNGLVSNVSGSFQTYNPASTPGLITSRNDSSVIDQLGIIYSKLGPGNGIQISKNDGKKISFNTIPLNANDSRFTSNTVNGIAVDKNNIVYLATIGGIVGINSDQRILETETLNGFIITPFLNGARTLANENVLSVAVDGGNRKWVGTSSGLYLFNDELSEILENFTSVNSPLPSNIINFLNLEPSTGELFIYTNNGIVSYRTNSTEGTENQENTALVFPNPVPPNFDGWVGISGLVQNALVKITDISGRLVFQTQANGGTASWNLTTQNGQRAEAGIYYIFSGNELGKENLVTKLAVIK